MLTRLHITILILLCNFAVSTAAWSLGAVHELPAASESNCTGANCPAISTSDGEPSNPILDFTPTPTELLIFGAALIALRVLIKKAGAAKGNAPVNGPNNALGQRSKP